MALPAMPPNPAIFLQETLKTRPERLGEILARGIRPEVDGRYLHWDELRRRSPPDGLTHEEWWVGTSFARGVLRVTLPLRDTQQRPFHFARTDSVQVLLHQIDREFGGRLEVADPQLTNPETRDRYIINSLMEEAITSSQLEGASTTRRVAKSMLLEGRKPLTQGERMIFNNFRAMELLRSRAQVPLSPAFLLELHAVITADTLEPGEAGRLRRSDEPVLVQDHASGDVLHIPPDAGELPARLDALCAFANGGEGDAFVHPVLRAIVLHFALAYDHPFVDGNGRTARALFYWAMLRQGYWMTEFLSISRVIQQAKAQYGRAFLFTETDSGDLTYFVLHQLGVIRTAIQDLHAYLDRKAKEVREVERLLKQGNGFNHRQRALLAHALRHPNARYAIEPYRREHGVVYQTARQDLLDLVAAGCLSKTQEGKTFYFHAVPGLDRKLRGKKG
jgi:Fic family protein